MPQIRVVYKLDQFKEHTWKSKQILLAYKSEIDSWNVYGRVKSTYRMARNGKVKNATTKQIAAPIRHPPNPSSLKEFQLNLVLRQNWALKTHLSHLDSANQASSSLDCSFDRNGI